MHQAVEVGHVGAHLEGHVDVGHLRQLGAPRVADDELGAVHYRVFQEGGGHGMGLGHIGANHEKHLGFGKIGEGIGHRPGTECCRQPGDGGGVSGTGAVIDVVRPDHGAE